MFVCVAREGLEVGGGEAEKFVVGCEIWLLKSLWKAMKKYG